MAKETKCDKEIREYATEINEAAVRWVASGACHVKQHGEAVMELAVWIVEYTLGPGDPEMLPAFTHGIEAKIAEAIAPLLEKARFAEKYHAKRCEHSNCTVTGLDAELSRWEPKS